MFLVYRGILGSCPRLHSSLRLARCLYIEPPCGHFLAGEPPAATPLKALGCSLWNTHKQTYTHPPAQSQRTYQQHIVFSTSQRYVSYFPPVVKWQKDLDTHGSTLFAIAAMMKRMASVTSQEGFPSFNVEYNWEQTENFSYSDREQTGHSLRLNTATSEQRAFLKVEYKWEKPKTIKWRFSSEESC